MTRVALYKNGNHYRIFGNRKVHLPHTRFETASFSPQRGENFPKNSRIEPHCRVGAQRRRMNLSYALSAKQQNESPVRATDNSPGQASLRAPPWVYRPITQPPFAKPRDSASLICGFPPPLSRRNRFMGSPISILVCIGTMNLNPRKCLIINKAVLRFMESLLALFRLHCDHEPAALFQVFNRNKSSSCCSLSPGERVRVRGGRCKLKPETTLSFH